MLDYVGINNSLALYHCRNLLIYCNYIIRWMVVLVAFFIAAMMLAFSFFLTLLKYLLIFQTVEIVDLVYQINAVV